MTGEPVWTAKSCLVDDTEHACLEVLGPMWKLTVENSGRELSILLDDKDVGRLAHHIMAWFLDNSIKEVKE